MRAAPHFVLLLSLVFGVLPIPLRGQDTLAVHPRGAVWGVAAGQFRAGNESLLVVGLQASRFSTGDTGLEAAIWSPPRAWVSGVLAFGSDLGLSYPLPVSSETLIVPRAGPSAVVLAGSGGSDWIPGIHGGVGALFSRGGEWRLRLDAVLHLYSGVDASIWSFSAGLLPTRRHP